MAINDLKIQRSQDIQISDLTLQDQYIEEFERGAISTAQTIVIENTQLHSKVITPEFIKGFVDATLSLETRFDEAVPQYLSNLLNTFQGKIDNILYVGDFDSTQSYSVGNVATYNKSLYLCIRDGVNAITDTTAWVLIGLQGETGEVGTGVNYAGSWNVETSYNALDMTVYNNKLYVAISASTGQRPDLSPAVWFMSFEVVAKGIQTGATEPAGIIQGDVWYQYLT